LKPLEGLIILDFAQFLAAPWAAMRLADLGARVIKVERIGAGDGSRKLVLSNLLVDGDSTVFHSMNRNKDSYAVNLKDPVDLEKVKKLVSQADVLIENFRPGTMERLGLGYEQVKELNSKLIYASVTGYGKEGPWKDKPGQDLLIQAISGLGWLNGNADQPPMPFGLSVTDMFASAHLVQGILAGLIRRGRTGQGALVEISLLESALDLQFEVLTTFLNDGGQLPARSAFNNAHAYLSAPYGIYETKNGYLALAMGSILTLAELLECPALAQYEEPERWFTERDEIKAVLAAHLLTRPTEAWLARLEPADYWCAEVLTMKELVDHEGFQVLDMFQETTRANGVKLRTTRCPIRIDGELLTAAKGSPRLGKAMRLSRMSLL